jgi:hypothetical protein
MTPEDQLPAGQPVSAPGDTFPPALPSVAQPSVSPEPAEAHFLKWAFFSGQGLRAGWSAALFLVLTLLFMLALGSGISTLFHKVLHIKLNQFSPIPAIIGEVIQLSAILGAVAICSLIERRRILDYNLSGPTRLRHFVTGGLGGFAALSMLVGALYWGGWLRFGSVALSGAYILQFGALWGIVFLLTGLAEEGSVRCYLQYTLTRGINLWWALGVIGAMCLSGVLFIHNEGIWGVYAMAALGMVPCVWLHVTKSTSAGFWQAAWVTSTLFGFIHTGNNGETWIGIFSAAAIGFVFCVSIRLTGSAWWAIGFHAAWDWGQTFFYGTADSGFAAEGHYLSTTPTGATLWSGGTDGPEGSLLVLPLILVILIALIAVYGRKTSQAAPLGAPDQVAG